MWSLLIEDYAIRVAVSSVLLPVNANSTNVRAVTLLMSEAIMAGHKNRMLEIS